MEHEERLKAALADRYQIDRKVGRGGMATVYLAHDLKHNRRVAVKVLDPNLAQTLGVERFLREIETAANLTHPHILPLFDSGEADGFLFYVMPYVKGDSLLTRLEKEEYLPIEDAVRITREIASALTYAHEEGVIHRDVKPANIMLEAGHAVLADFGVAHAVAKAEDARITKTGTSLGTPTYISPEQATGEKDLDGRSDQYALACVLFEMLAGHPPFQGPTAKSLLHQHLTVDPPSIETLRTDTPPHLAAALRRALAKEPSDRFETPNQFAGVLASDGVRIAPSTRQTVRRKSLAVVVGLAVLAAAGFSFRRWLYSPSDAGPPPTNRPYTVLATVEGTGDPGMRETVEYLLRSALDVAHVVQTVPITEVERLQGLMERSPDAPLDPATARELAERAGVTTVVLPRLDAVGNGFLVAARVEEVPGGHLLAGASRRAADADAIIPTVDAVARELRRDLGESRIALANTEPLPQVLTGSMEALRKFRAGYALQVGFRPEEAIPSYREALVLDPEFAEVHVLMTGAFQSAGLPDSARTHVHLALQYPERLSDAHKRDMVVRAAYDGDFALWDQDMFRSGRGNSDALRLTDFQHFDSAFTIMMDEVREVVRQARHFDRARRVGTAESPTWRNAVRLAIATGRLEEYEALVDSLSVSVDEFSQLLLSLAASEWERADSLRGSVLPEFWETHVIKRIAVTALDVARGRIGESYERWSSINSDRVSSERVRLLLETVYGITKPDSSLSLNGRDRDAVDRFLAHGVRSAILGDTTEARRVAARMTAARDSATSAIFEDAYDPMFGLLKAGIAARRGDWGEAARLLEPSAERLGEGGYGQSTDRFLVRWMLAEAYTHLGETHLAISEYDTLLQERSFEPLYVLVYAPTRFKLGQLHIETGDTAKAMEHYTAFLDAFLDPDPQFVWMVERAQTEVVWLEG